MLKGIIFLISFCIGFGWQFTHRPVIHIYLDFATLPSLLQMIDFVQAPEKDQKVIIWRRFPQRYKYVDLDALNAQQIPLPVSEVYNTEALSIIDRHIRHLYMNNPRADYVIHANLWWGWALTRMLQHIPPERVKHLYLYEDGLSNVVFSRKTYTLRQSEKTAFADDLKLAIAGKAEYHHNQMFSFHKLYPTTYYISFIDYMKTDAAFNDFFDYLNGAHLIQTDIRQTSASLTPAQKERLYLLLNFDKAAYERRIAGKKVDFFALRNLYSSETEQTDTVLHLFKNMPADHILVLKDHPSLATRKIAQKIKKNIPSALIFPHEQPFEILVIADLIPDTVSGYPSSIFFSVPDEKILYYVTADRDYYLNFLKLLHKIPDGKVFHSLKGDQ